MDSFQCKGKMWGPFSKCTKNFKKAAAEPSTRPAGRLPAPGDCTGSGKALAGAWRGLPLQKAGYLFR